MLIEHWKPKKNEGRKVYDHYATGGIASCVAMTTHGVSGDDKAVQPTIPCFHFEKKKYSNNKVENVPSIIKQYTKTILYISVMRISQ